MQIGDLSRHAGVNIETIRYYERAGVLPVPARQGNGRRIYGEADVRRLGFIRHLRVAPHGNWAKRQAPMR